MNKFNVLPEKAIAPSGLMSNVFLALGIHSFLEACRYVHELPYGYNSDRDNLMILFKERFGSCTTKHATIATLARELGLPIARGVGIYPMTEAIVTGTDNILSEYALPYVPMIHCFLEYENDRVDLTEGNRNGKNRPVDEFLYTAQVEATISAKDEYMVYRKALTDVILKRPELVGVDVKRILHAREQGLKLLKGNIAPPAE